MPWVAFRRPTVPPKTLLNFHLNFVAILAAQMVPKKLQNGSKIAPISHIFGLRSSCQVFLEFFKLFYWIFEGLDP